MDMEPVLDPKDMRVKNTNSYDVARSSSKQTKQIIETCLPTNGIVVCRSEVLSQSCVEKLRMTHPSLVDLPNELLYQICLQLDQHPPSHEQFAALPCFTWTKSEKRDLKSISEVSTRLRNCVLPLLFKHAQFCTRNLTDFLDFVHRHGLQKDVVTIVANITEPYDDTHPAWYSRILNEIRPLILTVCCSPASFRALAALERVGTSDDWAFRIPCQFLELCQGPDVAAVDIEYNNRIPGLVDAKSWSSMRFNEGSSVAAYTTFEYFFKRPPSLILDIQSYLKHSDFSFENNDLCPTFASEIISSPLTIRNVMRNLREFSYIATFPFYNNFDQVLACIREMVSLKKLFIQLCSDPGSGVLDREIQIAGYHLDINDPWNEAETAYNLLPHTVIFLHEQGDLETVITGDSKIQAIKDSIVTSFSRTLEHRWVYDGDKTWSKVQSMV